MPQITINRQWISKEEKDFLEKRHNRFMHRLLFHPDWFNPEKTVERGILKNRDPERSNVLKLAWIVIGKTRKMAWVDPDKKVAFKNTNHATKTSMRWRKFRFERWCTTFDL